MATDSETDSDSLASNEPLSACSFEPETIQAISPTMLSLREEIEEAIAPWNACKDEPPFSVEQLVVMALFMQDQPSSANTIRYWMFEHFRHWREVAFDHMGDPDLFGSEADNFQTELKNVFHQFEVPIINETMDGDDYNSGEWALIYPDCLHYIRSILPDNEHNLDRGSFPFTELPAELRNKIYEMALSIPGHSINIRLHWRTGAPQIAVWHKNFDNEADPEIPKYDIFWRQRRSFNCRLSLDVLCVSKQIYQEAMPVFYAVNHFAFDDLQVMADILHKTPAERRQHFGHLTFPYEPSLYKQAPGAFKSISNIQYLQRIGIYINENDFTVPQSYRKKVWTDVLKIPGLNTLRNMRGLRTVEFHGDCENIEEYLSSEMIKSKGAKREPKKTPKRKRL